MKLLPLPRSSGRDIIHTSIWANLITNGVYYNLSITEELTFTPSFVDNFKPKRIAFILASSELEALKLSTTKSMTRPSIVHMTVPKSLYPSPPFQVSGSSTYELETRGYSFLLVMEELRHHSINYTRVEDLIPSSPNLLT